MQLKYRPVIFVFDGRRLQTRVLSLSSNGEIDVIFAYHSDYATLGGDIMMLDNSWHSGSGRTFMKSEVLGDFRNPLRWKKTEQLEAVTHHKKVAGKISDKITNLVAMIMMMMN